jgi:hypothetical protein
LTSSYQVEVLTIAQWAKGGDILFLSFSPSLFSLSLSLSHSLSNTLCIIAILPSIQYSNHHSIIISTGTFSCACDSVLACDHDLTVSMHSDSRQTRKGNTPSVFSAYQNGDSLPIPTSVSLKAQYYVLPIMLAGVKNPPLNHETQASHLHCTCSRICAYAAHILLSLHTGALQIDRGRLQTDSPVPSRSRGWVDAGPYSSQHPDYSAELST